MAVQPIYDFDHDVAALICTTSDVAFGPIFRGASAREDAEEFCFWFYGGQALMVARELGLKPTLNGYDPRGWSENDLVALHRVWTAAREAAEEIPQL